jgi:CheY-like chemotaxis protein
MPKERSNIRVLIADDHAIFRDGLRKLLGSDESISIVGEAQNGEECIKLLAKLKPDVLLLRSSFGRFLGMEVNRPLRTDSFLGRTRGAPTTSKRRNDCATNIGEVSVGERGALCAGVQGTEQRF